jgi:enoyl-CoA hydratase
MTDAPTSDSITVIRLDDGRANALSPEVIADIDRQLDDAQARGNAVVICGREGYLSAGFDLKVMRSDPASRAALMAAGRALLVRLFVLDLPVVVACTGHAIAAGAGLLTSADWRVGARGPFRLGFTEVAIGFALSEATLEMVRYRMPPTAFESVVRGDTFEPEQAVAAGLLDELAEPDRVEAAAMEVAARLAALSREAYVTAKQRARRPAVEAVRRAIEAEAEAAAG